MSQRYISPITDEERMIDKTLRRIKRLGKIGIHVPVSQADLAELEAERDRLRQLRGYGNKQTRRKNRHSITKIGLPTVSKIETGGAALPFGDGLSNESHD